MQRKCKRSRQAKRRRILTSAAAFLLAIALPATALAAVELNIEDGGILVGETNAYQQGTVEYPGCWRPVDTESGEVGDWIEKVGGYGDTYLEAAENGDIVAADGAEMITRDVYKDEGAHEGTVVITGTSESHAEGDNVLPPNTVIVDAGAGNEVEVVLDDLSIDTLMAPDIYACPVDILSGDVTIELEGDNTLMASTGRAAIETSYADGEGSLTITDTDEDGKLYAEGSMAAIGHEVDIYGNKIEYDPVTGEPNAEPYAWIWDKCTAGAGIGGGSHWVNEWDPVTEESNSYEIVEAGKDITIEGGTITAVGGVEVSTMYDPETDETTVLKEPYFAPAIGGAVMWERGKEKVVMESDVTITGGDVTKVDGKPDYEDPWFAAPEGLVYEPADQTIEMMLGNIENAKMTLTNATLTEEVTDTGAKIAVVSFEKETGAISFDADNLAAIVEAGYSVLEVKLGDATVQVDLAMLKTRLGEGYRNISLRLVDGKLVLTAVGPDGVLVNLSDLLDADA